MSEGERYVTQREFDRTVDILRGSISDGQRRLEERFDKLADHLTSPRDESASLAMHHAAKAVTEAAASLKITQPTHTQEIVAAIRANAPKGGQGAVLFYGAIIVAGVAYVAHLVVGHW